MFFEYRCDMAPDGFVPHLSGVDALLADGANSDSRDDERPHWKIPKSCHDS